MCFCFLKEFPLIDDELGILPHASVLCILRYDSCEDLGEHKGGDQGLKLQVLDKNFKPNSDCLELRGGVILFLSLWIVFRRWHTLFRATRATMRRTLLTCFSGRS